LTFKYPGFESILDTESEQIINPTCNDGCIMKKEEFTEFLYEICADCDCHGPKPYCTLVEFIVTGHKSPRMLMQMKCVEKFRKENHPDVSWGDAFAIWSDEGYAESYDELYSEDLRFRSLYRKITERKKK